MSKVFWVEVLPQALQDLARGTNKSFVAAWLEKRRPGLWNTVFSRREFQPMDYESQKCRLCQQIKPLCRSHIVPEFAYEPIKNDKHQMNAIGLKTKKVQTGHFERLLCAECEALLSGYESEFKKGWIDTIPQDLSHLLRALPNATSL